MEKLNLFRAKKSFLYQYNYSILLREVCFQFLSAISKITPSHFELAFIWNCSGPGQTGRTSHQPNRVQERKTFYSPSSSLISIQFGSCEVWRLTPASETIGKVSFKQPRQHLHNTLFRSFYFHVFSKPTNEPTESVAYNCSSTRKHA